MFPPVNPLLVLVAALAAIAVADPALARSSDRNQPMDLVSDSSDCTVDGSGVCHFNGNVRITQGTLTISAARADLHRAAGDLSRTVLTGAPVVLKQQMDDGTPMTARAAKVDYNLRTEIAVLTGNVEIQQPRGTMSGERVVYNLQNGRVESGGEGNGRVRMRILPRNAEPAPTAQDEG